MNDLVTFYSPGGQGETLYLDSPARAGRGASKAVAYSAGSLDGFNDQSPSHQDESEYRKSLSRLGELLKRQGGLLIHWKEDQMWVQTFPASGYAPPSRLELLRLAAGKPQSVAFETGKPRRLQPGDRFLAAVDRSAEKDLQELMRRLEGFAPDIRETVLSALRSPSLDVRLNRLERHAQVRSPAGAAAAGLGIRPGAGGGLRSVVVLAAGTAALVSAFLFSGIFWANRDLPGFSPVPFVSSGSAPASDSATGSGSPQSQSEDPSSEGGPASGSPGQGEAAPGGDASDAASEAETASPPPTSAASPDEALALLIERLQAAPAESPLATLAASHLESGGDADSIAENPIFAWGAAKVSALASGAEIDGPTLSNPNRRSALKRALAAVPLDASLHEAFTFICCRGLGRPGLPLIEEDDIPEAYAPDPSLTCANIDPAKAVQGIAALTAYVEKANREVR